MKPKADPFARAKPFLVAYQEVAEHGFFETLNVHCAWFESGVGSIVIEAVGNVPDDPTDKPRSLTVFVNPQSVLSNLRSSAERLDFDRGTVGATVEVRPWHRFSKQGDKIIGTRGRSFAMRLVISAEAKK